MTWQLFFGASEKLQEFVWVESAGVAARQYSRDELMKKAGELNERLSPIEAELGRSLWGILPTDDSDPGAR